MLLISLAYDKIQESAKASDTQQQNKILWSLGICSPPIASYSKERALDLFTSSGEKGDITWRRKVYILFTVTLSGQE
jgi:hypothetical protein